MMIILAMSFGVKFILFTMALPLFVGFCISAFINMDHGGWQEHVHETVAWMVGVFAVTWIGIWIYVTFFSIY